MRFKDLPLLAFCLAVPLAVGTFAGYATTSQIGEWYAGLHKPFFNPPNWIFGPVWTTLYVLMGISLFLIWKAPAGRTRIRALAIFWVQLALNFAWSFLFFVFHRIGAALVDILLIWVGVAAMILAFGRVRRGAALLQIPYMLWVSFATVLNAAIWRMN